MNPKTKKKMIIDILMTILFLFLMNTAWTGLQLHEWFGIGIIALFTAHLAINRQWISSVARTFAATANWRVKSQFLLNLLLTLAMGTTLVSGVLISQFVLPFLAAANIDLWYTLHTVSSWLTLGVIVLHTVVHWRWIQSVIRRLAPAAQPAPVGAAAAAPAAPGRMMHPGQIAARALISIFALAAAYSLITSSVIDLILPVSATDKITGSVDAANSAGSTTQTTVLVQKDETETTVILPAPTTTAKEPTVTLAEYLSKLYCTACHKHCLLTRPQCARGVSQAKTATAKYYASLEDDSANS